MTQESWDDLRYVLAVAEAGTVSGAARRLGVNHATVLRRVAAFEARAGVALFTRTARGYAVPADRARLIEAAREAEAAMQAVARMLGGLRAPPTGGLRVTSTDSLCQMLLPPILAGLRREAPGLRVELLCSNGHLDLLRAHADITVRPAQALPDDLVGEPAARLGFAPYAAEGAGEGWLGLAGPLARSLPGRWLADAVEPSRLAASADSFLVLRELAAAGLGTAILPCFLADGDPRLRRRDGLAPPMAVQIWVASHADLADVPRLARLRANIAAALGREAERLAGRP